MDWLVGAAFAAVWCFSSPNSTPPPLMRGVRVVHAYAPSAVGLYRHHPHASVRETYLLSTASSDDIQGTTNRTDGLPNQGAMNLLPSTSITPSTTHRRSTRLLPLALLPLDSEPIKSTPSWNDDLVDLSNLASLLCVLDCTLLPFVSVAIPALSWGVGAISATTAVAPVGSDDSLASALSATLSYLPAVSHTIALYFVIPVGLLTTIVNYFFGHKKIRYSLLSLAGVAVIYVANSSSEVGIPTVDRWLASGDILAVHHGRHVHNACGAFVGAATGMIAHTCPEGLWAHRVTNSLGCALLLGSNYLSKKYMEGKGQGCPASTLTEVWDGSRAVCPPGCNCNVSSRGASSSSNAGEDVFFEWGRTPGDERGSESSQSITRLRR